MVKLDHFRRQPKRLEQKSKVKTTSHFRQESAGGFVDEVILSINAYSDAKCLCVHFLTIKNSEIEKLSDLSN